MISEEGQKELFDTLREFGYKGGLRFNEPLYQYTSFKLGGPCAIFLLPESTPDIRAALRYFKHTGTPWSVLGGGSNVLFPDHGFNGGILRIGDNLAEFEEGDNHLAVSAGLPLSRLMRFAMEEGYGGLEFLIGIPGTVGGAIAVNAGTPEEWIDTLVLWAEAVNYEGDPVRFMKPRGSYRQGFAGGKNYVIAGVALEKREADPAVVKEKMKQRMSAKVAAQPYGVRSAGCVFKNPPGVKAWELIESVGLKGHEIGGASFSEVHCNFIVCSKGAASADVLGLIRLAEERVLEEKGIKLEREIVLLGFDIPPPIPELPFEEEEAEKEEAESEQPSEEGADAETDENENESGDEKETESPGETKAD